MDVKGWPRRLLFVGLAALMLGTADPLEGSLVILAAAALLAGAAFAGRVAARRQLAWALALVALGVGTLWGLSAVGGFGGHTGRSNWWALLLLPYPIGWLLALSGALRSLGITGRGGRPRLAS